MLHLCTKCRFSVNLLEIVIEILEALIDFILKTACLKTDQGHESHL